MRPYYSDESVTLYHGDCREVLPGMSLDVCGPFTCDFPDPTGFRWLTRWRCPTCGTVYVRAKAAKERWWRNWSAPRGHWVLPVLSKR